VPKNNQGHPRVLFLTAAAFNKVTGGGVTFTNLFAGWPQDRIVTVHNDSTPVSMDVCTQYYRLGVGEIHKRGLLRYLKLAQPPAGNSRCQGVAAPRSTLCAMAMAAKTVLFGNAVPDVGRLTPELEAWVAAYKPDVLYTIMGTNAMMDLAKALCERFNLALVIHLMDDWPSAAYRGGLLSWFSRRRMQKLLQHLVSIAEVRMGICEDMADGYKRRYGAPFLAFQNAIDTKRWQAYIKQDLAIGDQVQLLYIGSVLPEAQLDALADCCAAVASLRSEGMDVVLDIYSPSFYAQRYREMLVVDDGIRLHDAIAEDEEVFRCLAEADILLLPVNFDSKTVRYIRYSMPTKVPAYLFSGTPILVYGSEETAQVRYARKAGWGYVVSERGQARVATAIRELASDRNLRERLSRAARVAAFSNHDASMVRARFQAALCESVRKQTPGGSVQTELVQENQPKVGHDTSSGDVPPKENTLV
jgi:glycosyltransferase involved in cell wall biosynthesis